MVEGAQLRVFHPAGAGLPALMKLFDTPSLRVAENDLLRALEIGHRSAGEQHPLNRLFFPCALFCLQHVYHLQRRALHVLSTRVDNEIERYRARAQLYGRSSRPPRRYRLLPRLAMRWSAWQFDLPLSNRLLSLECAP